MIYSFASLLANIYVRSLFSVNLVSLYLWPLGLPMRNSLKYGSEAVTRRSAKV